MSQNNFRLPFILSLIGGLLVLLGGIISSIWFFYGGSLWGDFSDMWFGTMGGYHGMMGSFGFPFGSMGAFSLLGLISGIIIVIAAFMLEARPQEQNAWGILIVVFSAISFLNMGGFFIGAILGLVGGAFALSLKKVNT